MKKPFLLLTIDTEGDNVWGKPQFVKTENARYVERFQGLCEKYGLKPTYLVNYEMATDQHFIDFGKQVLHNKTAEIGMHLHAWNSPPEHRLSGADYQHLPYLIEYPEKVIKEKVAYLTALLEDTFGEKMLSHRAGRWAMNEIYANALIENGYKIDCSVTPHVSWAGMPGFQSGGSDYRGFTPGPYFIHPADIAKPGNSTLLELPMTVLEGEKRIIPHKFIKRIEDKSALLARVFNKVLPKQEVADSPKWLRSFPVKESVMPAILDQVVQEQRPYAMYMIHSSELMPGGSPNFVDAESIEILYANLEALFAHSQKDFRAGTTSEFYTDFTASGS